MPPHVLIVEDSEDDLFLARRTLKKGGIVDLHHVADGRQAIDYLLGSGRYSNRDEFPLPEIILLDLKLPEISGHQVAEWIASQPQFRDVRRYILSSSGEDRDRTRAEAARVTGYYVKPLTPGDVQKILADLGPTTN